MMMVSFSREKSGLEMAITKKKHSKNDRGKNKRCAGKSMSSCVLQLAHNNLNNRDHDEDDDDYDGRGDNFVFDTVS